MGHDLIDVDIIFLSCGRTNELQMLTNNAIASLLDSQSVEVIKFNILVVESFKELEPYQYPNSKTIYPKSRFGFNRYVNIGIKSTKNKFLCICNNDLLFEKNWASEILKQFEQDDSLYSASPYCPISHPPINIKSHSGPLYGYEVRKQLVGWCIFVKRDLISKIGLFDPRYRFWYADNDYSQTLSKFSIKHALVTSSIVIHLGSATLETRSVKDQYRLTIGEKYYFEHKWCGRSYGSYVYKKRKLYKLIRESDIC